MHHSYQFTYKEEAEQAPGAVAGDVVVQAMHHAKAHGRVWIMLHGVW
jgi:hypothetical protein